MIEISIAFALGWIARHWYGRLTAERRLRELLGKLAK